MENTTLTIEICIQTVKDYGFLWIIDLDDEILFKDQYLNCYEITSTSKDIRILYENIPSIVLTSIDDLKIHLNTIITKNHFTPSKVTNEIFQIIYNRGNNGKMEKETLYIGTDRQAALNSIKPKLQADNDSNQIALEGDEIFSYGSIRTWENGKAIGIKSITTEELNS